MNDSSRNALNAFCLARGSPRDPSVHPRYQVNRSCASPLTQYQNKLRITRLPVQFAANYLRELTVAKTSQTSSVVKNVHPLPPEEGCSLIHLAVSQPVNMRYSKQKKETEKKDRNPVHRGFSLSWKIKAVGPIVDQSLVARCLSLTTSILCSVFCPPRVTGTSTGSSAHEK